MADAISGYLNTLIFCIIAKAITLFLLILLLFEIGWAFSFLILTIEIGLVAIIAFTLYKVYQFQKDIDDIAAKASTAAPFLDICPDYFVRSVDESNNNIVCKSKYTTPDKKKEYTFTDTSSVAVPDKDMTKMVTDNKTFTALCTAQNSEIVGFSWTDLKSRCGIQDTFI